MAYVYRRPGMPSYQRAAAAQGYDHRFQITPEGQGIAWIPGMVWPSIIGETDLRRLIAMEISAAADGIVARIMMRTKVEWESRHGNS